MDIQSLTIIVGDPLPFSLIFVGFGLLTRAGGTGFTRIDKLKAEVGK